MKSTGTVRKQSTPNQPMQRTRSGGFSPIPASAAEIVWSGRVRAGLLRDSVVLGYASPCVMAQRAPSVS